MGGMGGSGGMGGMGGSGGMGGTGRTAAGSSSGGSTDLARLRVTGTPVAAPTEQRSAPGTLWDLPDLRRGPVSGRRLLTLAMGMAMGGGMTRSFTIDGREFDPDRVDQAVAAGSVEEWTLANSSTMNHPFHLHVWPMQVVARDGAPVDDAPTRQDVVDVPARSRVTVRIAFDGFTGRTVYHCHILDHEDVGMMGVIEVDPPP
jgi:FtsP/CotA-like multicopper oxidase with cupredoxin domain